MKMSNPFEDLFSKFSKTRKLVDKEIMYGFYEQVSKEIQSGHKEEGVWAKAFAESEGDEQKAKAIYIELMVEKMDLEYEARLELEKESEKEKQLAERKKQEEIAYNRPDKIEERKKQKEFDNFLDSFAGKIIIFLTFLFSGFVTSGLWSAEFVSEWYWIAGLFIFVFFIVSLFVSLIFDWFND